MIQSVLAVLLLAWAGTNCWGASMKPITSTESSKVKVSKCCPLQSVLEEYHNGNGSGIACRRRSELLLDRWRQKFHDPATGTEVEGPVSYLLLDDKLPTCDKEAGEVMFPVYEHDVNTFDELLLLANGSLAHRVVHGEGLASRQVIYAPGKYCVDDMILTHNLTLEQGDVFSFAYICVNNQYDMKTLIDEYVYPIALSVSMLCLVATFLLYSFLPQLRDLTGKFILGICSFLAAVFALFLVRLFGWRDPNIDLFITELSLHTCVVGCWLCLNCMGHHVWKVIKAKSVFTRVTDGRRLLYYSGYVSLALGVITASAVAVIFLAPEDALQKERIRHIEERMEESHLGWASVAAFYIPVTLLLLVNVYFYLTAQRRIAQQMIYNRSMQHFQVNFDLYTKFLIVVGVWWLFFMLSLLETTAVIYMGRVFDCLAGPLVFIVAMCRTRVAFLFKRYFCVAGCRGDGDDFIEEECKELSVIDGLKEKLRREEEDQGEGGAYTSLLPPIINPKRRNGGCGGNYEEMSRSLFCVRGGGATAGEVPPPPDPDLPVGRVKRLLKSNSLTALANINWGWRRETSV